MRNSVSGTGGRHAVRLAILFAAGTLLAGCSSGVARFSDDIFTGSTENQRSIIRAPQSQPFPGDAARPQASTDSTYTGSVARSAVTPVAVDQGVQRGQLAPAAMPAASAPAPRVAAIPAPEKPRLDGTVTNSTPRVENPVRPIESAPASGSGAGWTRAGGTTITVREGETVYNLSRRFGVPVGEILKANDMASADNLVAGRQMVIPTYVYSAKAPVSAPDSDAGVAHAKSSRGSKFDVPDNKVPVPSPAPQNNVAILPQNPKVKERDAAPVASTNPAAPSSDAGVYTVQSGDTLYGIAKKTGVSAASLRKANGLSDGFLRVGQKLVLPNGGATVVASAEPNAGVDPVITGTPGPSKPAKGEAAKASPVQEYTPPRKADRVIEEAEQQAATAPETTGVGKMRWPVRGKVISGYGASGGGRNDGIDIAVPAGTPVKASENGVVIYAGDGLKEFGNTVLVRHEDGLVTVYGHASELKVSRGDRVKRGQEIARSGMSGKADMPKLHFEVRKDSAPVDPSGYLE